MRFTRTIAFDSVVIPTLQMQRQKQAGFWNTSVVSKPMGSALLLGSVCLTSFDAASLNPRSMGSFLFSLGAKLQFKKCSGGLSRSKGYQGSGKFCLLRGLQSARAGLATTLWTLINT